ncbi:hypothetical protein [Halorussus pelagicus]|uniref:hypothetical protein n=1 Tax=Halorussus pelagicus TaxID=2505977 RepID=UPI000FFCAE83|nr:hypothetical protein [Halorussus pelagicus]
MSDDEEQLTADDSLYALRLSHRKLNETLADQVSEAEHIDKKAMSLLRASFTFSGVAAAIAYYISRQHDPATVGSIDNPLTYAGILFGVLSIFTAFATVYHTKLETEIGVSDLNKQATFGRKEMLATFAQTYPNYIDRNDKRLNKDKALLSISQALLAFAAVSVTVSGITYVSNRTFEFYSIIVTTFVVGCIAGVALSLSVVLLKY